MKWFKHLSGSLSNSIIFEAIEKFGGDGYLVFFGTLELMSDEFDIHNPGINRLSIKKMTKSFQLSRQKTLKILRHFDQKAKENTKKKVSFLAGIEKEHVLINCKRLADLCDNHTGKLLRDYLKSLQSETEVTLSQEVEDIDESAIPKIDQHIDEICKELYDQKIFPKVHVFKNAMLKKNKNKRAILHTLSRCLLKREFKEGPYAYCVKIITIEDGNYNESEYHKAAP